MKCAGSGKVGTGGRPSMSERKEAENRETACGTLERALSQALAGTTVLDVMLCPSQKKDSSFVPRMQQRT